MPSSISLEAGNAYVQRLRKIFQEVPEVTTVLSHQGRPNDGTDATGFFNVEILAPLKPIDQWRKGLDKETLIRDLGAKLDQWEAMLRWASDEHHAVPSAALAWLRANQPPDVDDPALCWGDSRIGNQLFDGCGSAATTRVSAVLDWEMVHVGDPIQDLGWFTWLDHTLSAGLDQPQTASSPRTIVSPWRRSASQRAVGAASASRAGRRCDNGYVKPLGE